MPVRIAICGGGIGGLVLATSLCRAFSPDNAPFEVQIFERASSLAEVGAGFSIWPRTWGILQAIGLADALMRHCPADGLPPFEFRRNGKHLWTLGNDAAGRRLRTFHRANFQNTLLTELPSSCQIHTSKRLASYRKDASGEIILEFADGSSAICDILIGADGVNSSVRASMLKGRVGSKSVWSGTNAYRTVILSDKLPDGHPAMQRPTMYVGPETYLIAYPIVSGSAKAVNFAGFHVRHKLHGTPRSGPAVEPVDDIDEVSRIFLRNDLGGVDEEIRMLIDRVERPLKWAVYTVPPLDSFLDEESGRVCLLGDAAHAMVPHQGAGAGQAVEDAHVLSSLLLLAFAPGLSSSNTKEALLVRAETALRIYDRIRRPITQDASRRAINNGQLITLADDPKAQEPLEMKKRVEKIWNWVWTTSADDQVQEGARLLEEEFMGT